MWRGCQRGKPARSDQADSPSPPESELRCLRSSHKERSSSTFHDQSQPTAFREAGVVVQLSNLRRAERQDAVLNLVVRAFEAALQPGDLHALHAHHGLRGGDQLAQVDAFAKTQLVRM